SHVASVAWRTHSRSVAKALASSQQTPITGLSQTNSRLTDSGDWVWPTPLGSGWPGAGSVIGQPLPSALRAPNRAFPAAFLRRPIGTVLLTIAAMLKSGSRTT